LAALSRAGKAEVRNVPARSSPPEIPEHNLRLLWNLEICHIFGELVAHRFAKDFGYTSSLLSK
jgi:hypothetical protein